MFKFFKVEKTLNHYYRSEHGKAQKAPAGQGADKGEDAASIERGGDSSSPERTGTTKERQGLADQSAGSRRGAAAVNRSMDNKSAKDERRAASHLLQQAKRAPYDFCKVSFVITLPYEMLVEQI